VRWIISLLALANFAVYLWGTLRPHNNRGVEFTPLDVGVIRLIGESPDQGVVIPKDLSGPANASEDLVFLSAVAFVDDRHSGKNTGRACGELVWFKDAESASEMTEALSSAGAEAEYSEEVRQVLDGYWVMIPPQADRQVARQQLAALQKANVKDTWLMPSGLFKNAISLGLYSRSSRAQSRARTVRNLGFGAKVQPNYDRIAGYRVAYRTDKRNAESIRAAAAAQKGLTHRRIPCK